MQRSWFFAGFFLFGGASLQASSYYLFVVLIPALLYSRSPSSERSWLFYRLGVCLTSLYLVFVLSNIIGYVTTDAKLLTLTYSDLLKSRFSTSVLITGIVFIGLAFLSKRSFFEKNSFYQNEKIQHYFHTGIFYASLIVLVYCLVQHFTGFDYRMKNWILGSEKLMGPSRYRSLGFYSHPLSLASVSLALSSGYWLLVWSVLNTSKKTAGMYALIAGSQLLILVTTGARFAFFLAVAMIAIVPFFASLKPGLRRLRNVTVLSTIIGGIALVSLSSLGNRFIELYHKALAGQVLGDRLMFWKVHWQMFLDRAFFGQGFALTSASVKKDYYSQIAGAGFTKIYNAHNLYLETLATSGVFGLFTIGLICSYLIKLIVYERKLAEPRTQVLITAFFLMVLANAVHGFLQNTFFDTNVVYLYLTYLWLIGYSVTNERQNP